MAVFVGLPTITTGQTAPETIGWESTPTSGGFASPAKLLVPDSPVQIVAADFNGDGKPDLAVVTDQALYVLLHVR